MSGRIIHLHGEHHDIVQALLPWYVTGALGPADLAQVEAHLTTCADCQADLRAEQRLRAEIVALPLDTAQDWEKMRQRIEAGARRRAPGANIWTWLQSRAREAADAWNAGPFWVRLTVAAQFCLLLVLSVGALPHPTPATYHVLGAPPTTSAANVLVMFRSDATAGRLREALDASDARVADGPTAAGAYLLHVPPAERAAALAKLRGYAEVELAEPVDGAASP